MASGTIAARLQELGITLPPAAAPVANFVGAVPTGNMLYVSGQGPTEGETIVYRGRVGADLSIADGQAAARLTALNVVAQAAAALDGDLDRIVRVVKLFGLVNCAEDFTEQPKVMNGASDVIVEIFGEAGRHARAAVGSPKLPFNIAVEVDGLFEVR